ncbi:MAG TPA: polyprenyl synthetase family protein, partial [Actinomycetota bacterium]|nr:polyprenyl synthetase family protein [Actinomycetota bacterium]
PMLTLLGGFFGDPNDERLVPCGAAIELTHIATLYHDDVIEDAKLRRGVPTANARYGNTVAVLAGDFLLARASGLAADLGAYVSKKLSATIAELCEGQIMETEALGRLDVTGERYLEVIRRKTASLIATSCHMGAYLGGAPQQVVDAISEYGNAVGIAFQLADDILDVTGDEASLGKTPGTDLRVGVLTLPVLDTLAGYVSGEAELRAALVGRDVDRALAILRDNGSLDRARLAVGEWQRRALDALELVPAGTARNAFERLAEFVGGRNS